MNILFLSNSVLGKPDCTIVAYLKGLGHKVTQVEDPIDAVTFWEKYDLERHDFIVSFGYRHILSQRVLDKFPDKAINLHISMLPWNRGSSPNLWSWIENTPKGVTIHYMTAGLDKGDIIAQREVPMGDETLASSYNKLKSEIEKLFMETWPLIEAKKNYRVMQTGIGSYHCLKDQEPFNKFLENGYEIPVTEVAKWKTSE